MSANTPSTLNDDSELWQVVLTLTDAIATIERKYHHNEITYDEYEEHSKRYEAQAVSAIHQRDEARDRASKIAVLNKIAKAYHAEPGQQKAREALSMALWEELRQLTNPEKGKSNG